MPEPEHEIKVTLRDVYDKVEKHEVIAASINAKLDLYIGLNAAKEDKVQDHEVRIRTMERWVFAIPGVAVVLSTAGLMVAIVKG